MLGTTTSGRIRSAARRVGHIGTAVLVTLGCLGVATVVAPPSGATLATFGPTDPSWGYPSFYGDSTGTRLTLCLDAVPPCFTGRPDLTKPPAFPGNWDPNGEAFYFIGEASIDRPAIAKAKPAFFRSALEGAFLPDVAPGNQVVFTRIRVRIDSLLPGASYSVTHPYGAKTFTADGAGVINDTIDIGCLAPPCEGNFGAAMAGPVGPWLQWDPAVGPPAPAGYIGSFGSPHKVVGSPLGTNFFRVTGPNVGGVGINAIETNLFDVAGKLSASIPAAPSGLTAAGGPGGGQITLNWTAPTDDGGSRILGYKVYRGTATGALTFLADVPTGTTFTDSGLPDNATRFYAVTARNAIGESTRAAEASATTFTRPSPPTGTNAVAGPNPGEMTVQWTAPTATGSGPITGYRVYRGTASGALSGIADVAASPTSFVDTGLPEGAKRFYAVTALAAAGESLLSNEGSATTFTRPTAPLSTTAGSGPGAGQITVTWSTPASTGGSAITGYRVYGGTTSGALTTIADVGAAVRSFTENALGNGTTKIYAVSALNAVGEGLRSNEAAATTFVAPAAPSNLTVSAGPAGGDLSLSWVAPSTAGGSGATSYRVYRATAGGTLAPIATVTGGATTFVDHGLAEASTFTYAVSGINAVGEGAQSASVSGTTFARPTAPRAVTATAGPGAGQITVGWTAPLDDGGAAVDAYRIYRTVAGGTPTLVTSVPGTARSFADSGLPEGAARTYTVTAHNAAGEGAASTAVSATSFSRASAPVSVTASPNVGRITLQWSAPTNSGGTPITGYRVFAGPSAAELTAIGDVASTARSFTESPLAEATTRTYAVAALNAVGEGAHSATATAATFARPTAPLNVTVTAGPANGSATIQWSPPASNGGAAITNYRILRGTSAADLAVVATVGNAAQSFTDNGLPEGATRTYGVLAVNAVGDGALSEPISVTTFARPATPAGFAANAGPGNSDITLHWLLPASDGGRPITGYRVYRGTTAGNLALLATVGASATSFTDSGLPEGVTRFYAISALNAVGESVQTATLSATVFARPTAPRAVTAVGGPSLGQATITWQVPASDGGRPVTAYRIYRSTMGGAFTLVGTVTGSTMSFTEAGAPIVGVNHYRVTAVNGVGESAPSADACALALPVPISAPCLL